MANNTNWLNISSQSGSSGQTILTLSANKNLSTNYKTAEITAYNPVYNISAKTYVTLEAYSPILSISPDLFGVPDSGGTYELTITANCAWVIAFPDLVTSYSTTAGTGNAVVTFTVPGTTADTTLVGNIVVTDESGQVSRTAKVEQYGSGVHIGVFPVELYFDSTGGSKTFSVTADAAYNVSVGSGTDWAFVEPHSGYTGQTTFTVTVNSENTGTTDKQGVINIDAPGQDLAVILYHKKPETRLIVGYYVTSTTNPTVLMYSGALSSVSQMEYPDGTQITPATAYTFPSTGMQYVYYTLTGGTIPQNMFNGTEAYMNDKETIREVYVPEGVTSIAYGAFRDCFELTAVTLPDGLLTVGEDAFRGCIALPDITFPEGLLYIGTRAFDSDNELHTIVIPSSVTGIGSYAFTASSVSSFTFNSLTPPTLGNANALSSSTLSEIIVPCPAVNDYITAYPQYAQYISCSETGTTLYFTTDTSNVKGIGETRTITILNTNINPNRTGLNLPSDFPQQGAYTVDGNVIYLTYPKNPSTSATRSWTIGVVAMTKDGVSLSGSYRITQNAYVVVPMPYTADTSTITKSGETRTITIDTSGLVESSITISVEGATGVTTTYQNGVITVVFPYNNETNDRNIKIGVTASTTNDSVAIANIDYAQRGGEIIYVIPYTADTSNIGNSGETRTITIDTSGLVESSITISVEGATGVTTSYSNGTITLVFPSNAEQGRAITVTVHMRPSEGDDAYAVIYYYQDGINAKGEYFSFKIETDGVIKWYAAYAQYPESAVVRTIQYRINNSEWTNYTSSTGGTTLQVSKGDIVEFRGDNSTYSLNRLNYSTFYGTTCKFSVFGNIMSLINSTNFESLESLSDNYTFNKLFWGTSNLLDASKLVLPATSLMGGSYYEMFGNCTGLVSCPTILPALTLATSCYEGMFSGCTSLKLAPVLPATNLSGGNRCYFDMFFKCTSLTTAPELPATTLADDCYSGMFQGCTNLANVQSSLPASYIPSQAYRLMFAKCKSLVKAPDILATGKINSSADPWTLASMFSGCSNLNYVKCLLPEGNNGSGTAFYSWLAGVSATGTFVTPSSANWTTDANGIPSGWTRVNSDT